MQNIGVNCSNTLEIRKGQNVLETPNPPKAPEGKAVSVESSKGRLKYAHEKMKAVRANDYIMRVVSDGYAIPFN